MSSELIAEHMQSDKQFMIQNFGEGQGIEQIKATAADILVSDGSAVSIDLGDISVTIQDYGFAQTGGDLFVFVPSANVLWTGNRVIAKAPALPWLLEGHLIETRDTLTALLADVDNDTTIIPGRGPVTDIDAIRWHIDYLNNGDQSRDVVSKSEKSTPRSPA